MRSVRHVRSVRFYDVSDSWYFLLIFSDTLKCCILLCTSVSVFKSSFALYSNSGWSGETFTPKRIITDKLDKWSSRLAPDLKSFKMLLK